MQAFIYFAVKIAAEIKRPTEPQSFDTLKKYKEKRC